MKVEEIFFHINLVIENIELVSFVSIRNRYFLEHWRDDLTINYIEKEIHGDSISTIKETEQFLKQIAVTLITNLKERFDCNGILQNLSFFDTKIIQQTTNDKIGTFENSVSERIFKI